MHDLRFNVARSIRYHDQRRGFFELSQKLSTWLSLIISSGAVLAVLKNNDQLTLFLTAAVAVISALSVVFQFSTKLIQYTDLKARFLDLESSIAGCTNPTEADVVKFVQARKAIERGEPPISKALNLIIFNDTVDALGMEKEHKAKIGLWQRFCAWSYLG